MVTIVIAVILLVTTETGPLTDLNSLFPVVWLAHKHLEFSFIVAPEMGVYACMTILCFYGVYKGTEPRFSRLWRSHFILWAIFPAPASSHVTNPLPFISAVWSSLLAFSAALLKTRQPTVWLYEHHSTSLNLCVFTNMPALWWNSITGRCFLPHPYYATTMNSTPKLMPATRTECPMAALSEYGNSSTDWAWSCCESFDWHTVPYGPKRTSLSLSDPIRVGWSQRCLLNGVLSTLVSTQLRYLLCHSLQSKGHL